jgi:hypothetical protein
MTFSRPTPASLVVTHAAPRRRRYRSYHLLVATIGRVNHSRG